MSLVEEYYELNEAEEVSAIWKIMEIIFYVLASCLGLWCGYTLALLRLKFDDKCYLFTAVKLSLLKEKKVDTTNINWGSDSWCDYCQYSMVCSFIVGTIWATFFLMCGKGGKSPTGLPQPWRIVWPSLIFNFIYFVIALCTAIYIQQGTDKFCARQDLNKRLQTKSLIENCKPLKYILEKNIFITALQLEIVSKASWGCAVSWLILFLISLFRIIFVIDFQLYKVCVFKIGDTAQNKKEEVLRITNYEEPKKIQLREENNRISYVDSEDKLEDFEQERRRRARIDKSIMRPFFKVANQPPMAFYFATDIRRLNREKKKKKTSKSLDETFEKNTSNLPREIRKMNPMIKVQPKTDEGPDSERSPFLCHRESRAERPLADEEEEENAALSQKQFDQNKNDSKSEAERPIGDFRPENSICIKKFV